MWFFLKWRKNRLCWIRFIQLANNFGVPRRISSKHILFKQVEKMFRIEVQQHKNSKKKGDNELQFKRRRFIRQKFEGFFAKKNEAGKRPRNLLLKALGFQNRWIPPDFTLRRNLHAASARGQALFVRRRWGHKFFRIFGFCLLNWKGLGAELDRRQRQRSAQKTSRTELARFSVFGGRKRSAGTRKFVPRN